MADPNETPQSLFERIYNLVRQIPAGKVAYYSQIGALCGGCGGRVVGFALVSLKGGKHDEVPWQRVVNIQGRISPHGFGGIMQRQLLEQEGIEFRLDGSIDFERYLWDGICGDENE